MTKYIYLVVGGIIVALLIAIGLQSEKIKDLEQTNRGLNTTIATQSKTILTLKADAENNRRLTDEVTKLEAEARSKSDEIIKTIPQQVKSSNAFNAIAPRNIIDFLRE